MFKKYSIKPISLAKKIRNRSSSRVVSLPEEESLLNKHIHKSCQKDRYKCKSKHSGINGSKVDPEPVHKSHYVDITSDPGIKEFQEYYKIYQDLSRLEVQVKKIQKKANMFRNARVLNSNSNDEAGEEAGDGVGDGAGDVVVPQLARQ